MNATEDEEVFNLYALYQKEIFHENPTMESFMDFLGDGFLTQDDDHKLGTYWLKWYIDGELVAVSVLDMYPSILVHLEFILHLSLLSISSIILLTVVCRSASTVPSKKSSLPSPYFPPLSFHHRIRSNSIL